MKHLPMMSILLSATIALGSCSGDGSTATPRPTAFPRLAIYDTVYTRLDSLPVSRFEINAGAKAMRQQRGGNDGSTWLNVVYPRYADSSVIYVTFTPVTDANRDAVLANRTERMAINTGDNDTEITRLTSVGGLECSLVEAMGPTVTPIQFIASGRDIVITGAYYIATPGDSVKPYIDAVKADVIHTLKHLAR